MPGKEINPVEQRIKSFAFGLRKDFGEEIRKDPSKFKARVIGTLKAILPRERPGRKGSSEIKQAAEIYTTLYASKGRPGDWQNVWSQATQACQPRCSDTIGSACDPGLTLTFTISDSRLRRNQPALVKRERPYNASKASVNEPSRH